MKKSFLVLVILLLNSCGYTPIYSSKGSDFKVLSFQKNIDNTLTNYIENTVTEFSSEESNKNLNISFNFSEEISVILKDSKGDPTRNRLKITIDLSLSDINENLITTKVFSESFEYNIDDNKFKLKQYEKNIKLSLVQQITQEILQFLANVK